MGPIAVDVEALKRQVRDEVERNADSIVALSEAAMSTPELGFAEHRTAEHVSGWLTDHDLAHRSGLAVTGIKAVQHGGAAGPTVGLLGELDGVRVPDHPLADPETGAAPACGHHAQLAAAAGAYLALRAVLPELDGSAAFVAVPAEELLTPARLERLREAGSVELGTGKAELLRLGELDDVDLGTARAHRPRGRAAVLGRRHPERRPLGARDVLRRRGARRRQPVARCRRRPRGAAGGNSGGGPAGDVPRRPTP